MPSYPIGHAIELTKKQKNLKFQKSLIGWYREDFERSWREWSSLAQFFAHYRDNLAGTPHARELLASENAEIQFIEFDWMPNEKQ